MLAARGIRKEFGAVTAADDLNIEIPSGSVCSLIGSNGAGKTTFVNMVSGYIRPDAGVIEYQGRNIVGLSPRAITRLGIHRSFQIAQLCNDLTTLDNMAIAQTIADEAGASFFRPAQARHRLEAAGAELARFGIADFADRPVTELPGGVKKLLDIAMAMAGAPGVMMLDEPTSGVAADEKFPIMDKVMQVLSDSGVTVLFVEHDMEIVTRYASRVLAFYAGRIIADDPPDRVLADPQVQRYVTGLAP